MKQRSAKAIGHINFIFSDDTEISLTQLQIDEMRTAFMESACGKCWMKKTKQLSSNP